MKVGLYHVVVDKSQKTFFPHKQMSEHAKIRTTENTKDLHGKPEAEKTTEEREFTISRKNYSGNRVCCDYKCSRVTLFLPFLFGKKGIFISLIGDVVDANIMDGYNHKI